MTNKRILHVLALIVVFFATAILSAQVPVEVSKEKIIDGSKVYYMHKVVKGQTLYSISIAYKVSIDAITGENSIAPGGIQTGQILRIPAGNNPSGNREQPPASGKPSANASSGRITPGVDPETGIRISKEKIIYAGKPYYMHEVMKGQTLYSIARAYKVTILDIDRENAIPAGGIRVGQVLRIPAISALTTEEETKSPAAPAATTKPEATKTAKDNKPVATQQQAPRQEQPKQQEVTYQQQAIPHQETPAAGGNDINRNTEANAPGPATTKPAENKVTKTQPVEQQQEKAIAQDENDQQKVQPERRKIHKVQKGESLSDIAKKYCITVQQLKQANKGVIFAMPDMYLVIPQTDDQQDDSK